MAFAKLMVAQSNPGLAGSFCILASIFCMVMYDIVKVQTKQRMAVLGVTNRGKVSSAEGQDTGLRILSWFRWINVTAFLLFVLFYAVTAFHTGKLHPIAF
jgi:hypothetical protein